MRRRIGMAFWLGGTAAAVLMVGSAAGHTLAGNEQAARSDAKLLLGRLKLPKSAVPVGREKLSLPPTDLADAAARWQVPESAQELLAFIEAHRPYRGGRPMTGVDVHNGKFVPDAIVQWPQIRGVIHERFLDIELIPQPGDTTVVEATASVDWWIPKSAVADALAGAGALTVTRGSSQLLTTTDPPKIERIAAMFEALPILQPGAVFACYGPNQSTTWTSFTFYASLGGRELARVKAPKGGGGGYCSGPGPVLSVPRQEPVYLFDRPSFLAKLGRILGITLR